jgi:hypothetical protein
VARTRSAIKAKEIRKSSFMRVKVFRSFRPDRRRYRTAQLTPNQIISEFGRKDPTFNYLRSGGHPQRGS